MKKYIPTLILALTSLPMLSLAHEGHGLVQNGPAHYIFSFEHALPLMAILAAIVYLVRKGITRRVGNKE